MIDWRIDLLCTNAVSKNGDRPALVDCPVIHRNLVPAGIGRAI